MKVFIIDGGNQYDTLFTQLGMTLVSDVHDADLVCFTGGADVSPSLYGDSVHPSTYANAYRDARETALFDVCLVSNIPMVGICRGAQFLNVMSGGRMYQDVKRHVGAHEITDVLTNEQVKVSSTHHQMMMPASTALLVAYSTLNGDREWYDMDQPCMDVSKQDIEVVWYAHTKCLCFQPHPEFTSSEFTPMKKYFRSLLKRFNLIKELS